MSFDDSLDTSTIIKLSISALVGVLIGCVLGAVHLINKPVKEITEVPDEYRPAIHYVLEGRTAGGDSWKYKATEIQDGKEEVSFLETELNRWASTFSTNYPKERPSIYLEPGNPLFRLDNDQLLISAKAESGFGIWQKTLTLSCEGAFVPAGGTLQMEPEKLYIGSLRVPGPAKNFVWNRLSNAYILDDEFQSLWTSIESASVHESQLIITAKR